MIRLIFLFGAVGFFTACGGVGEKFEKLKKLRGIGVSANPMIAVPSTEVVPQIVTLTTYVSVPLDQDISVDTFEDVGSSLAFPVLNLTITTDPACTEYGTLQICSFESTFVVPSDEVLHLDILKAARLRYGFNVTTKNQVENMVGDVLVVPEDSDELDVEPLTIDIKEPLETKEVKRHHETAIEAEITNENDENVKMGWFISAGELKNRRAVSTTWTTGGDDEQTLIATVRGKRSRGFAMKVLNYKAE
jgi:hypothetical protein